MLTARLGPRLPANTTPRKPPTARERRCTLKRNCRFATIPPAKLPRPLMRGNARPLARRAQLPRRVQLVAPDHRPGTAAAHLTAICETQRTSTGESGARRAQRRPKARREPMTGGINTRMSGRWILGLTIKVSGPRPPRMERRSHVPAGPLDHLVRPQHGPTCAAESK